MQYLNIIGFIACNLHFSVIAEVSKKFQLSKKMRKNEDQMKNVIKKQYISCLGLGSSFNGFFLLNGANEIQKHGIRVGN